MRHTRLWIVTSIIAGVIILLFVLSVPHTRDGVVPQALTSPKEVPSVALRDVFKKGTHTITGSIHAPNPCTSIAATATLLGNASSSTESILVELIMPKDSGVCLEQDTERTFSTTLAAPSDVPLQATVNGVSATITAL